MTRYVVPSHCLFRTTAGRVALAGSVRGGAGAVCWRCDECEQEWPVHAYEQLDERRRGLNDRRRQTRADRRTRRE
jgi:sRNA-binding protein